MEHARYRELLERHLDGDVTPSEREELFAHLEDCDECRQILQAEERLAERLSRIPRLVAPSDLRANILKEAMHEREQLMHVLDEESRYAKAVRGLVDGEKEEEEAEFPYFAGSDRRQRHGLLRTLWSRYSPIAAVFFAVLAGVATLLTSEFPRGSQLASLQSTVRNAAHALGGAVVAVASPSSVNRRPPANEESDMASAPVPNAPAQVEIARKETTTAGKTRRDGRSAVAAAIEFPDAVASQMRKAREAVHQIARAASDSLPEPAELANPVTSAIIVKAPSDHEILSLDPDDFGDSLRETAETRLGGSLTRMDQFAFEGRRYRCYSLRVSANLFDHLVQSLKNYRAPSDNMVLKIFREQGYDVSESESVVFLAASGEQLRSAAETVGEEPPRTTAVYRDVKVFVVE